MTALEILLLLALLAGVPALVGYVRHDAFRSWPPPYHDELGRPLTHPRH